MKSQLQKKVICKQRDLSTGDMFYFVVNESRERRRGCWVSSADIDLSALILERSICIDEKFEQCKPQKGPPEKLVTPSQVSQERLLSEPPLSAQLAVAKAQSEMERTLVQHEIDAGRLILRSRELGYNGVPASEMSNIRLVSLLRLEEIFRLLESFGFPSRDRSYILSLLYDSEKAAFDKFRMLESAHKSSIAVRPTDWRGPSPPELGAHGVPHEQVLQANRTSPPYALSAESMVRPQLSLSATELQNQGEPAIDTVSSVQSEALAGAFLGTNFAGSAACQLASMGGQFQPSFYGSSSAKPSSSDLRQLPGSQTIVSRGPSPSLMVNPMFYGQSHPATASNSGLAITSQSMMYQQLPNPYLREQQSQAAFHQHLYSNGGLAGPNTMQQAVTVSRGYTMQDFEPRTVEEMQQQTSEANFFHTGNGGNRLP